MADPTPDPIMRVASGFMAAKYLFVATEVGLFDGLADGPSAWTTSRRGSACPGTRPASWPMRW